MDLIKVQCEHEAASHEEDEELPHAVLRAKIDFSELPFRRTSASMQSVHFQAFNNGFLIGWMDFSG